MKLWLPLLALAGLGVAPGAAAPLTIRLVSVGSLPPVLLGFLQEGLTRETGRRRPDGGQPPPAGLLPRGPQPVSGRPFSGGPGRPPARPGRRLSWGSPGWTSRRPVSTSSLAWPIPGAASPSSLWPASTRNFTASPGTPACSKPGPSKRRSTNWGTSWAWTIAPIRPASCPSPTPWPTPTGRGRGFAGVAGSCLRKMKFEGRAGGDSGQVGSVSESRRSTDTDWRSMNIFRRGGPAGPAPSGPIHRCAPRTIAVRDCGWGLGEGALTKSP